MSKTETKPKLYYFPNELESRLSSLEKGINILIVDEIANSERICFNAELCVFIRYPIFGSLDGKPTELEVTRRTLIRVKSPLAIKVLGPHLKHDPDENLYGLSFPEIKALTKDSTMDTLAELQPTKHSVYIGEREIRNVFHNDVDDRGMPYAAQALNILLTEYQELHQ